MNTTTGLSVGSSSNVASAVSSALIVGFTEVVTVGGIYKIIETFATGEKLTQTPPLNLPRPIGKRISWREVVQ